MKKYIPAQMIRKSRFITFFCNLLTSIAMIMVLEQNGKTREEAEKEVSEAMYEYIKLRPCP